MADILCEDKTIVPTESFTLRAEIFQDLVEVMACSILHTNMADNRNVCPEVASGVSHRVAHSRNRATYFLLGFPNSEMGA